MTFEIVAGILTLLGGFISVGTLVWKLSAAVNKLECTVSALHEWVEKQADKNRNFYEKLENHEKRLYRLESRGTQYDSSFYN